VTATGTARLRLGRFLNFPRRDPHDVDRVADHVGGAFLAFGASGHFCEQPLRDHLREIASGAGAAARLACPSSGSFAKWAFPLNPVRTCRPALAAALSAANLAVALAAGAFDLPIHPQRIPPPKRASNTVSRALNFKLRHCRPDAAPWTCRAGGGLAELLPVPQQTLGATEGQWVQLALTSIRTFVPRTNCSKSL
jgi:hypothetical protein